MSHFDKAESIATNTLLVPDIPLCFFGCDDAMLLIHDTFAAFGPIYTFVQMKGFRRLMIIFQETVAAMKAKTTLDKHIIIWKERVPFPEIVTLTTQQDSSDITWEGNQVFKMRVYYGQHFAIHVDPKSATLQVPQFERNLLISPPGSPFEGWEQIEEDAPNQAILASDLIHAAEVSDYELDDDEFNLDSPSSSTLTPTPPVVAPIPSVKKKTPSRFSIVCAKGLEQAGHLPSITVQDWDGNINVDLVDSDNDEDMFSKKTKEKRKTAADIVPTAMPPMHH